MAMVEQQKVEVGVRLNANDFFGHDDDHDRALTFPEFCELMRDRYASTRNDAELRLSFDALDSNSSGVVEFSEYVKWSLRDALARAAGHVVDLMHKWDDDRSGRVDRKEFRQALKALGFQATTQELDMLFDELDTDGSGMLEHDELARQLDNATVGVDERATAGKLQLRREAVGPGGFALDAGLKLDAKRGNFVQQLRKMLKTHSLRVLDLFRAWDEDGNGLVDRDEFRRAMVALGLGGTAMSKRDIESLFAAFDRECTGQIEYRNILRHLRPANPLRFSATAAPGCSDRGLRLKASPRQKMICRAPPQPHAASAHRKPQVTAGAAPLATWTPKAAGEASRPLAPHPPAPRPPALRNAAPVATMSDADWLADWRGQQWRAALGLGGEQGGHLRGQRAERAGSSPRDGYLVEAGRAAAGDSFDAGIQRTLDQFATADVNRDSSLSFIEFCMMVRAREGSGHSKAALRARFNQLDADFSGKVRPAAR